VLTVSLVLVGCGGSAEGGKVSTTVKSAATTESAATDNSDTTAAAETTEASAGEQGGGQAETEVSGMPAEFPADVPVHPGTVTVYDPMKVTDSTTVHQLTVETTASLDDVVEWYKTKLPEGWSVGFAETKDGEAKIALNGGDYTPAKADTKGGGVLVGVSSGDKTIIVVTVTVTAK
jgi:hypothetical protein